MLPLARLLVVLALSGCARGGSDAAPPTPVLPVAQVEPAPPPVPGKPPLDPRLAVLVGDCDTVRAHPELAITAGQRLALARCQLPVDPAAAMQTTEGLDADVLAPWVTLVRGEAILALGRPADALATLEGLRLPGGPDLALRLLRARARIGVGQGLEARDDLRALLDTSVGDEARFLLAEAAAARGDLDAAIPTWRRVWIDSTRGPWSERAAAALAKNGHPVPELATAEGREDTRQRVAALTKANRHEDALALLLDLSAATGTTLPPATLARASFRARRYPEAIAAWARAYGTGDAANGPPGDLFDDAVASLRAGDRAGSLALYRRVIALYPSAPEAEQATYKLAWVPYDARDCDEAIAGFDAYLAAYPSGPQATSARWFRGWCAWREDRRDEAVETWQALLARSPTSDLAAGARYWTARAAGLSGDVDAERAGLEAVVRAFPGSGHAWLAARRLGRAFPEKPAAVTPAWPTALASSPAVQRAVALTDAGLSTWALAELGTVLGSADDTREGALAAAHALVRAGDAKTAHRLAKRYCVAPWQGGDPIAQQACFGRPAQTIVSTTAERYGLHPLLPYAIMHSESGMDPDVTSYAGARGLMQIMPFEGPRLHTEALGHGTFDPDALYDAQMNALLGTTLLGLNARTLQGSLTPDDLPAVIASYNGGVDAVQRWIGELGGRPVPFDVFAEEVGYTQTRQYVRGVLGHLLDYLWVYGEAPSPTVSARSDEPPAP